MRKIVSTFVSLALLFGLASTALASARTTQAPTSAAALKRAHVLRLDAGKSLTAKQLKAEGVTVKRASRGIARFTRQLHNSTRGARAATAGCAYWYTYQIYDNSWVDRWYCGPYESYPYAYYVIYDNFKTCEYTGENCIDANAYTYRYLVYDYETGEWNWWYNTSDPYGGGWGPYYG